MKFRIFCLIAVAGLFFTGCRTTRSSDVGYEMRHYRVEQAPGVIQIDGLINEEAWQSAAFSDDFENVAIGVPKMPERLATRMKMLRCDDNLYIAIVVEDDDIWSTFTDRNEPLMYEESVAVFLDPQGEGKDYFGFYVNPLNALFDIRRESGSPNISFKRWLENASWEAEGIEHAVSIDGRLNRRDHKDSGWVVEMRIPFAAIGHHPQPGDIWRAQFGRIERPRYGGAVIAAWQKTLVLYSPADFGFIQF